MQNSTTQPQYEAIYDPNKHILLRGYPRDRQAVEEVQKVMQAKLIGDNELDLLLTLDTLLGQIRAKLTREARAKNEKPVYPEYLQLPGDEALYLPIPFEVKVKNFNLPIRLQSFHKPAWFRVPKLFVVGGYKNINKDSK